MADINLLADEEKQFESFDNLRKKLSVASVLLLVFTAIATLGTLAYFTTLASARGSIVDRVEAASAKVNSYKNVEELAVVTKDKVMIAGQILAARSDKVKLFNAISQLIPKTVSFSDVKVSQGKIVFSGQAKTSADIAALVSGFSSAKGAEIMSGVSVDSLVSDEKGQYSFGISAALVNK